MAPPVFPEGPIRWLLAAQALFVAGGVIAYVTPTSFALWTAIALVAGLAGVWQARPTLEGQAATWMDRSASAAAGAWAILAVLIIMPYIALDSDISLWADLGYQALLFSIACLGMMLWSAAAFQAMAQWDDVRSVRTYAAFHVVCWAIGLALLWNGDGTTTQFLARGQEVDAMDLALVPMVGAVPGLVWLLGMLRLDQR